MKKIILSLTMIVAVGAIVVASTGAFFNDTETSTGNTFTAGEIDLKIDSEQHYNGNICVNGKWTGNSAYPVPGSECGGTWGQKPTGGPDEGINIVEEQFFNLTDVKPGDNGENTISMHIDSNDAWACAKIDITSDEDVTCSEPEDDVTGENGNCSVDNPENNDFDGEMAKNLSFAWWADNGDNMLQENEKNTLFFLSGASLKDILAAGNTGNSLYLTLSDSQTNFFNPGNINPITGGVTKYVAFAWCFGDMNISGTNISCDGGPVGNEAQTDSLTANFEFTAIQSRNNADFRCVDTYKPRD